MGYVAAEMNDVFISYARDDDDDYPFVTYYVEQMAKTLRQAIRQLEGSRPSKEATIKIWTDNTSLEGHGLISENLERHINNSALLVIFMSKAYLESKWCEEEANHFLKRLVDKRKLAYRVFVLLLENIEQDRWPNFLKTDEGEPFGRGFPFYAENNSVVTPVYPYTDENKIRPSFHARLKQFAMEIAVELKNIRDVQISGHVEKRGEVLPGARVVFISADENDRDWASKLTNDIRSTYEDGRVKPVSASANMKPSELIELQMSCDGIFVIWGQSNSWPIRQYVTYRNTPELKKKIATLICYPPPLSDKGMKFDPRPEMGFCDFSGGTDLGKLRPLIEQLF